MSDWKFTLDVVIALAAFIGMVLGIFNFVRQLRSEKVNIRVIPLAAHYQGPGSGGKEVYITNSEEFLRENMPPESVALRVTNLSTFPVKIREVGFLPRKSKRRHSVHCPRSDAGDTWPQKMAPRASATFYVELTEIISTLDATQIECAYVSTDCGNTFKGKSPALKQLTEYFTNGA